MYDHLSALPIHITGRNICASCGHDSLERFDDDPEALDDLTPGRRFRDGFPWYHFIRFRCQRCSRVDDVGLDVVMSGEGRERCYILVPEPDRKFYAANKRFKFIERLFDELEFVNGRPEKGRRYFRNPDAAAQAVLKNAFTISNVWSDLSGFEQYRKAIGPPEPARGRSSPESNDQLIPPGNRRVVTTGITAVTMATFAPFPFGAASFRDPGFTGHFDTPGEAATSIFAYALWILLWILVISFAFDSLKGLIAWLEERD